MLTNPVAIPEADRLEEKEALPTLLIEARAVPDAMDEIVEVIVVVPLAPTHRSVLLLHMKNGAHRGLASSEVQAGP